MVRQFDNLSSDFDSALESNDAVNISMTRPYRSLCLLEY